MRRTLLIAIALALLVPATALAGGWATVQLDSLPAGGKTWKTNMTVKQHGQTPLDGLSPAVVLQLPDGGEERFTGMPTDQPGVYSVTVKFPENGRYTYTVDDGFTNAFPHNYPAVEITGVDKVAPASAPPKAEAPAPAGSDTTWWAVILVALGAAAAGTLAAVTMRRRRGGAQPA